MAILASSSAPLNTSYAGTGSSPLPSVARTRGRRTGTRRPPKVTDPASVPCRVAVRSGSCLPFRPHAEVTSACINCCMTCTPGADREGEQSLAHVGSDLLHRDADMVRHGKCRRVGHGRLILLGHSGPLSLGVLGGSPETYHPVGLGRGTATSSSTRPGTTSARWDALYRGCPAVGVVALFRTAFPSGTVVRSWPRRGLPGSK